MGSKPSAISRPTPLKEGGNHTLHRLAQQDVEVVFALNQKEHFLKRRRRELGISQSDLVLRLRARGVSLSRSTISAWELGKRELKLEEIGLEALASSLEWSLAQLKMVMRN